MRSKKGKKPIRTRVGAIEDTPQQAASTRARAHLVIELTKPIRREGWMQKSSGGTIWSNTTAHPRFDARQGCTE